MSHEMIFNPPYFTCNFHGVLTTNAIEIALSELGGDSRSDSLLYGLVDFTNVEKVSLTENVSFLAASFDVGQTYNRPNHVIFHYAFVTPCHETEAFISDYAKKVKKATKRIEIKLFKETSEAKSWLKLKEQNM